jgi:hypothetical protein
MAAPPSGTYNSPVAAMVVKLADILTIVFLLSGRLAQTTRFLYFHSPIDSL